MEFEDGKPGRGTSSPYSSYASVSLALRPLTCGVTLPLAYGDLCLSSGAVSGAFDARHEGNRRVRVHDAIVADRRSGETKITKNNVLQKCFAMLLIYRLSFHREDSG